jgi:hypothetical protein
VGGLLVGLGWLASPAAGPVYDGVGLPDEPYRYVVAPAGATTTVAATGATAVSPVKDGRNTDGLSVQTGEQGPQFSLFLPQFAMAAKGSTITIRITPEAVTDGPAGTRVDGNGYRVELVDAAGPVTLTDKAAIATLYLRSTSQRKPQPTMYYRAASTAAWRALPTSAGGFDVRVASFLGAGEYVVARPPSSGAGASGSSVPVLPLVLVGILVVLVGVVLVVRLRAGGSDPLELSTSPSA